MVAEIRVSLDDTDHAGTIIFEDNGREIPAAQKNKIFTTDIGKKPSFGLVISREILGYHDNRLKRPGYRERGPGLRSGCRWIRLDKDGIHAL
jgi:hypothetical protein